MSGMVFVLLVCGLGLASALPTKDPVIMKTDPEGPRYRYLRADDGTPHLVDTWLKISDVQKLSTYNDQNNIQMHLLTPMNPTVTRYLIFGDADRLLQSNFNPNGRTFVLIHGFLGSLTNDFNQVLVPALLAAGVENVIVLDWSAMAYWGPNAGRAAVAAAAFIDWMNEVTGANPSSYYIAGYSVGGHAAGILGRTMNGEPSIVYACDPSERWDADTYFQSTDAQYTEVIHTSSLGVQEPIANVDMYPNGGTSMPGCLTSICNHQRSYEYLAESMVTGGFTGRRCETLAQAQSGNCNGISLRLGGLDIKYGMDGMYTMRTNRNSPFSQG